MKLTSKELVAEAIAATMNTRKLVDSNKLPKLVGCVGSALETVDGNIFTGINLVFFCGIGFCAEHSAISDMLKHGHSAIKQIVAVTYEGQIIPPCGRCRELLYQVSPSNLKTQIIVDDQKFYTLDQLLPQRWQDSFDAHKI